jgi:predicted nucleotidyltransferase
MLDLLKLKPEVERVCRLLPVKRLGFFGFALTRSFAPDSDVDVLVVFDADESIDLFDKYFELKERLESIFEREADLVVDKLFEKSGFPGIG